MHPGGNKGLLFKISSDVDAVAISKGDGIKTLTNPAKLIFSALTLDNIPDLEVQFHKMQPIKDTHCANA